MKGQWDNPAQCAARGLTPDGGRVVVDRNTNGVTIDMLDAIVQLIVAIEWEVPAIRDGVGVDYRCGILLAHAQDVRETLRKHGIDADNPEAALTPDRSGEADKTAKQGLAEGESGLPEGSSK